MKPNFFQCLVEFIKYASVMLLLIGILIFGSVMTDPIPTEYSDFHNRGGLQLTITTP